MTMMMTMKNGSRRTEVNRRLAEVHTDPSPPPMVGAVPWRDRMPTFGLPAPP